MARLDHYTFGPEFSETHKRSAGDRKEVTLTKMQQFEQFLWPPTPIQEESSQYGDSDMEDAQLVEQLVDPHNIQRHNSMHASPSASATPREALLFQPVPVIALNNVPVPESTAPSSLARPSTGGLSLVLASSRNPQQRTPSPRASKRSSPGPSLHRTGPAGGKVRLVNVPDVQQETLMGDLKQLLARNNQLFQNVEKDLLEMKQDAIVTKELAERAEKRAIDAEKALESERLKAEQRLQKIQSEIQAEASKQIHEAERRAEITLKSLKNMEQSARPRPRQAPVDDMVVDSEQPQNSDKGKERATETLAENTEQSVRPRPPQAPVDGMVVDSEQPQNSDKGKKRATDALAEHLPMPEIPVPPRFPRPLSTPSSSSLPKPLNFKRPKSSGKPVSIPPLHNTYLHGDDSDDNSSGSEGSDEAPPSNKNASNLTGEELLKLLLSKVGLDIENIGPVNKSRGRRANRDFKEPAKKDPKPRGKQELMNWLRHHLHALLGIKKSHEILNFSSELYSSNTPLQRQMEQWEKTKEGEAPKVKPMKINWNNFDGPWNTHLCELFVQYCAAQGLERGNPGDEVNEFVASYFWDRLARLRTVIKKSRPKKNETIEQNSARTKEQHLQSLSVARRNSRRNQKHHDRIDICLENLPENIESITTDQQRDWKKKYDLIMALGPEGMSSDETDVSDADTYWVRTLPWRSKRAMHVLLAVDNAKNTTNGYGNTRPGNRPRNRQRKSNALDSARKPPIGKPKNLYERDWYEALNAARKMALKSKADLDYL